MHALARGVPMVMIYTGRQNILGTSTLQYPGAQLLPMVCWWPLIQRQGACVFTHLGCSMKCQVQTTPSKAESVP